METRIYRVERETEPPQLVEAATAAQALRHVTRKAYQVKTATTKEVASLVGQGVKVEQASVDQ